MVLQVATVPKNKIMCNTANVKTLDGAYYTQGGVKGSLKYMSIEKTATGTYEVKLKNLIAVKQGTTSITEGNYVADYTDIVSIEAWVEYGNVTATGMSPITDERYTSVAWTDTSIKVYTLNASNVLEDLVADSVLQVKIYTKHSVAQFSVSADNPLSMPMTVNKRSAVVWPFYIDVSNLSSAVLVGAPEGTTVLSAPGFYILQIPKKISHFFSTRLTVGAVDGTPSFNIAVASEPYDDTPTQFNVDVFVRDLNTASTPDTVQRIFVTMYVSDSIKIG